MAAPQPIENQQRSYEVFEKKHYMECTTGQRAMERSANAEAISHFTQALALLTTLPETSARTAQELTLHLALAVPLIATKGYASPDVKHAYLRAQELCQ